MSDEIEMRVFQTASDILGVPASSLSADSSSATIEGWDSVQHLNLILALESVFGVQFEPEEMEEMKTLGKIIEVIRKKCARY